VDRAGQRGVQKVALLTDKIASKVPTKAEKVSLKQVKQLRNKIYKNVKTVSAACNNVIFNQGITWK
jgi:hypothetical protein